MGWFITSAYTKHTGSILYYPILLTINIYLPAFIRFVQLPLKATVILGFLAFFRYTKFWEVEFFSSTVFVGKRGREHAQKNVNLI